MTESYRMMITKNPGYAPLIIGEYLYESNRFEESLPHLMKALDEARSTRCPGALVPAMVDLARIKRAQGDMPGAFEVLEECETEIRRFGQAHWIYLIQAFRCRLYMDAGDTDGVEEWFAGCRLNSITQVNRIREFELMVYARVLLARGRLHDARPLLQRLLVFTEEKARLHSRVEVLNLLALLDFENNKLSGAVNYLESSLETGMKEGYVRSFIDEFTPLARLLRYYITSRKKGTGQPAAAALRAYAKSLLKQMHENPPTNRAVYDEGAAGGVKDFLTAQEKKVLQLIVEANTNQEISQKLGIALRTVKNHIANIYGKLGVKNRAQCIKLVRESGLL
jgi:LuxR family maltose regulon positive regulatory protein